MNKSSTDGTVLATGMRILFAAYIDFMFFGSLWGIMIYFITPYIATEIPPITKFISFLIIEAFVISKVRISPGFSYLSIRSLPWREVSIDGVVTTRPGKAYVVPRHIKLNESWITMFLGYLILLEGLKEVVRWTMWTPPMPLLGDHIGYFANILFGTACIVCAFGIYKLRSWGYWSYFGINGAMAALTIAAWDRWGSFFMESLTRRRAWQGRAVKAGDIETLQSILPVVLIVMFLLGIVAMVLMFTQRKRFRTP